MFEVFFLMGLMLGLNFLCSLPGQCIGWSGAMLNNLQDLLEEVKKVSLFLVPYNSSFGQEAAAMKQHCKKNY